MIFKRKETIIDSLNKDAGWLCGLHYKPNEFKLKELDCEYVANNSGLEDRFLYLTTSKENKTIFLIKVLTYGFSFTVRYTEITL